MSSVRFLLIRLVTEDDKVYIYHNLENARVYHDNEIQNLEITPEVSICSWCCCMWLCWVLASFMDKVMASKFLCF